MSAASNTLRKPEEHHVDERARTLAAQLSLVAEASVRGRIGEHGRHPTPGSSPPSSVGSAIADEFQAALAEANTPEEKEDVVTAFEHRLSVQRRGLRRTGPPPAAIARVEQRRRERHHKRLERQIREDPILRAMVAERERQAFEDGRLTEREEEASTSSEPEDVVPEPSGELARAVDLIADALREGPRPGREVRTAATAAGVSEATLRRARDELEVLAPRGRGSVWSLPE